MKLNQLPNLRVEDFPSESSWISKLFIQLNPFIQAINQVLDENVDFTSNIKAITKEYEISTFQAFSFTWSWPKYPPVDVRITKAVKGEEDTSTILLARWTYDTSSYLITIDDIVEVNSSSVSSLDGDYTFTLRASV